MAARTLEFTATTADVDTNMLFLKHVFRLTVFVLIGVQYSLKKFSTKQFHEIRSNTHTPKFVDQDDVDDLLR